MARMKRIVVPGYPHHIVQSGVRSITGEYLLASIRYIEQNPTKAKIVKYPWKYKWSSAGFHCGEVQDDPLVQESSLLPDISNWKNY
ncbi:MAG: hypothetical protein GY699_19885 [Desulfobacteraceae bacterium]|nr:hypothetical protein [Desulfobacteraceae bacterium]